MPALKGRQGHILFGSLQTPGLWVELAPLVALVEPGFQQQEEGAVVWGQEVHELGQVEGKLL